MGASNPDYVVYTIYACMNFTTSSDFHPQLLRKITLIILFANKIRVSLTHTFPPLADN